jgi:hypothetical protein
VYGGLESLREFRYRAGRGRRKEGLNIREFRG